MISMQNMKYIVEIAKHHSISSAAKSLFVSQSTLSTAVREVEQQLGISIFKRNNRGIEVTFEGQDFLNHAKDIVEQSEYLERRYKHRKTLPMRFSVSTQRLPFSVMSFIQIVEDLELRHYDIAIRECRPMRSYTMWRPGAVSSASCVSTSIISIPCKSSLIPAIWAFMSWDSSPPMFSCGKNTL
ncbi:LysR family transcriptional regulator [Eubacterium callanderi]|uniref:LysR family transcriptional regulator n=1 Tax=Eubacterium callanderi TaxID=53442 RepID=A0A853JS96_9FIRM|nr:LysR family transcriptional regulator [Eubacterium callanderi]